MATPATTHPERLQLRAAYYRAIRSFFYQQDFLEVDTPVRQKILIPERYIRPIEAEGELLQTSPELAMKRLLAAGCTRIFQICPCFRKNEIGRLHLEEFRMLEWYRTGVGYLQLMADCEALFGHLAATLPRLRAFDLATPWSRITVSEAFASYSPISLEKALKEDLFDEILVSHIEPELGLGKPCFLYDYPVEQSCLAAVKDDNPMLAERFELYLNGIELANGCSELIDAKLQRQRFLEEITAIKKIDNRNSIMPEDFLRDLEKIPSAAGVAIGLDRLFMLAAGEKRLGSDPFL